jgi:hypothetical protein
MTKLAFDSGEDLAADQIDRIRHRAAYMARLVGQLESVPRLEPERYGDLDDWYLQALAGRSSCRRRSGRTSRSWPRSPGPSRRARGRPAPPCASATRTTSAGSTPSATAIPVAA